MPKKKILIVGLSNEIGGIETLFKSLLKSYDTTKFIFEIMSFDRECAFKSYFENRKIKNHIICSRGKNILLHYKQLKAFFRKNDDFDFVWYNTASTSSTLLLRMVKRYTNSKIIVHSHGTSFESNNQVFHKMNILLSMINRKYFLKNTDLFFACSKAAGQHLFGEKKQVHVINNGVEVEKFKFSKKNRGLIRKEFNISSDTYLITNIGRLSVQKNQNFLLSVFKEVLKLDAKCMLMIVGIGPLENELRHFANTLGIYDKVVFTGLRNDIEDLLCASDCFVLTSLFEGLAVASVEAQCTGIKCVFSDTISSESKLISDVSFLSLDTNAKMWAEEIMKTSQFNRESAVEEIIKEGYDIMNTYKYVEDLFLS